MKKTKVQVQLEGLATKLSEANTELAGRRVTNDRLRKEIDELQKSLDFARRNVEDLDEALADESIELSEERKMRSRELVLVRALVAHLTEHPKGLGMIIDIIRQGAEMARVDAIEAVNVFDGYFREYLGRHRSKESTNLKDVRPPDRPGSVDEVFASLLDEK